DHGPILAAAPAEIGLREDAVSLTGRLAALGADLLVRTLARQDEIEHREQDHAGATYAPKLAREDRELEWTLGSIELDRRVRAFQPWPGVTLPWRGGRLTVLRRRPGEGHGEPGPVPGAGPGA